MQKTVRILDDGIVNQIAAGEVVERPASVVKELVENSLDAGATEITVVIVNGGRSSIEVADNGWGMRRDDALLAVERFGTSKISDIEDLYAISTHGFRGEALPSIAAVSRFTLSSCAEGEEAGPGVEIEISGGKLRNVTEREMPQGTRVQARNLFFNIPARRKFLRTEATEAGLVKALLADFALSYPKIRLSLVVDGNEALAYPGVTGFAERVKQVRVAREPLVFVEQQMDTQGGGVELSAALSQPVNCVSGSARLRLLVNNRSVRDRLLLKAVRDGYGNFLKPGKYPAGVVKLTLNAQDVDVNVHPQKTEVRFRAPEFVFSLVRQEIARSLDRLRPESGGFSSDISTESSQPAGRESGGFSFSSPWYSSRGESAFPVSSSGAQPEFYGGSGEFAGESRTSQSSSGVLPEGTSIDEQLSSMRYVGQIFRLYLVMEGSQRVALVDMHAAHERVMFYKLKQQLQEGGIVAQGLLLPETVELPPEQAVQFERFQPELQRLGIECEQFGENCVVVRSMPALLGGVSPRELFEDLFSLSEWSDWSELIAKRSDEIVARLACHSSVRSGREIKSEEVYELLRSLEEAEAAAFCPHGRPVAVFFSGTELESMFGRA